MCLKNKTSVVITENVELFCKNTYKELNNGNNHDKNGQILFYYFEY